MAFTLDATTGQTSALKILLERRQLLPGPAKRPDLTDVVFPGGIVRRPDGRAQVYLGVGDVESQVCTLPDPFRSKENRVSQ